MNAPTPDPMLRMTPQKASARMVPVDEPTEREVTPAVRRTAEAMEDAALRLVGRDLGTIHRDQIAREGLAAGLDVEEMARAVAYARHRGDCTVDDLAPTGLDRHIARAISAALLGPDLVAVDDEGEDDL